MAEQVTTAREGVAAVLRSRSRRADLVGLMNEKKDEIYTLGVLIPGVSNCHIMYMT
jgi:hypothetical protein